MRKFSAFSLLCLLIFFGGIASGFKQKSSFISEAYFYLDFSMQIILFMIFSAAFIKFKRNSTNAFTFFKTGCIFGIIYTLYRCLHSTLNAYRANLDAIPAIPIIAITGSIFLTIFLLFFLSARNFQRKDNQSCLL